MIELIELNKNSNKPIYIQLADGLKNLIKQGKLLSGQKMPSRRTLSEILKVSENTVNNALTLLINEGYLITYPKSGYVVSRNLDACIPDWASYIKRAKHRPGNKQLPFWSNSGGLTDFGLSSDFDMQPYIIEALKEATNTSYSLNCKMDFSTYGYTPLREHIVKHVEKIGIKTELKNVLICPGGIQVLYPLYESLMTSGSNFLHEQSNIIVAISDIHSIGMNMIPVSIDKHGLSASSLEKAITKWRHPVLHVDLADQAPTGIVMSRQRRKEIIQIVDKYRLPVVEIDHLRDAWHNNPFPFPLKSMDKNGNVIYMGMSIRCCPFDMQLSWIVADELIVNYLSNVMVQAGIKPNFFMQVLATEMFRSGMYDIMMNAVRAFIKDRRQKALRLCSKYLSEYGRWDEKNCGFHFWLDFPEINTKTMFKDKFFKNFHPGYFFDKSDTTHILICPSSICENEIETSIKSIAELVERYVNDNK